MINVGFCEALDLREASKGEVVTVGVALHGIGYSFFFSGFGIMLTSSKGISARSRKGTLRGSEPVKLSLGLLNCLVLSVPSPKVYSYPLHTHYPGAKDISRYVAPLY